MKGTFSAFNAKAAVHIHSTGDEVLTLEVRHAQSKGGISVCGDSLLNGGSPSFCTGKLPQSAAQASVQGRVKGRCGGAFGTSAWCTVNRRRSIGQVEADAGHHARRLAVLSSLDEPTPDLGGPALVNEDVVGPLQKQVRWKKASDVDEGVPSGQSARGLHQPCAGTGEAPSWMTHEAVMSPGVEAHTAERRPRPSVC